MPTASNPDLKSQCEIDLGFPFQAPQTPSERLRRLAARIEAGADVWEYYCSGPSAEALEARVAELTGKPAALWFPTGTMAQGVAARIHCDTVERPRLALHPTSHLLLHEHEGVHHLHGLELGKVGRWNEVLNADDIPQDAGCFFLELGQRHNGGLLPSWEGLEAIKERASAYRVALHMDGARLWSVRQAYDNRSYAEICDGFESVYVSLYKDVGAMSGAVLVGSEPFIEQARIWRARMGGMLPVGLPFIVDALDRLDTVIAQMPELVSCAKALAGDIDRLDRLSVTPPQTNLFHIEVDASIEAIEHARDRVAQEQHIWLFSRCWDYPEQAHPAIEINIGDKLLGVDGSHIINGFKRFAEALTEV